MDQKKDYINNLINYSKVSEATKNELVEIAMKSKWDLIDDLLLTDIIKTSDGFYLQREDDDIGYNRFLGEPNLSQEVIKRMKDELNQLSESSRKEASDALRENFPKIYAKVMKK